MKSGFKPISSRVIVSTLYNLRAQITRDKSDGLEYVDALLRLHGADPEAQKVPSKLAMRFRRGELKRLCLRALRDGPQRPCEIARSIVAERNHPCERTRDTVKDCLRRMAEAGVVRKHGRQWALTKERLDSSARVGYTGTT